MGLVKILRDEIYDGDGINIDVLVVINGMLNL